MGTQHRNLNDLFAQARSENSIVSQQEIDALIDAHELHGRQFEAGSERSEQPNTKRKRGIIMGILSTVIVGGLIGAGTFFWDGDSNAAGLASTGDRPLIAETVDHLPPFNVVRNMPAWSLQNGATMPELMAIEATTETVNRTPASRDNSPHSDMPLKQKREDDPENNTPDEVSLEKEAEELGRQIGSFVTDYWYDRINSYRQFIDRSLGATDLEELNRLRVRWELSEGDGTGMLNFQLSTDHAFNRNGKSLSQSMSFFSNDGENPKFISNIDMKKDSSSVDISLDDQDGDALVRAISISMSDSDSASAMALAAIEESDINVEVEVDTDGQTRTERKVVTRIQRKNVSSEEVANVDGSSRTFALDRLDEMPIGNMLKMAISLDPSDRSSVLRETWEIADRNRSRLDDLKEQVMNDVATFNRELGNRLRGFAASSDTELAAKLSAALEDEEGFTEPMMRVLGPLYDVLAEPMLMLYNGSDITRVLSSAITEPVAGITLEGRSALAQSYPNPASSRATIDFTLTETSNATTLRLFDVIGNEVIRKDLGGLRSGAHSHDIDLSALAAGTYLYHLTIEGTEGSRVWSRTLEVVR